MEQEQKSSLRHKEMKTFKVRFFFFILIWSAFILNGCYGGKLVKMPINADLTYRRLDTLKLRQEMIMLSLDTLSKQLREERKARLRGGAESASRLSEIDESLSILENKINDAMQLMEGLRKPIPKAPIVRKVEPEDTSSTSDSTSLYLRADEEGKLFKSSYMDLTLGNYSLALQGFKNYLVRFPNGVHVADVHYYIGECYYTADKYLEAVGEYRYLIKEFPGHRLVPAAYLKAGLCYVKLENKILAKRSFGELISKYPHSEEAEHARAALKDLGG